MGLVDLRFNLDIFEFMKLKGVSHIIIE